METKNVIVVDSFDGLCTEVYQDYLAHAFCTAGTCRFLFNGKDFELQAGDVLIVRKGKLIEKIRPSVDFRVKVICVTPGFIELCTPQSNYGMKGQLSLFLNPVMRLSTNQQEICRRNFEMVEARMRDSGHHFYREILINSVQTLILDFYDFHSNLYGEENITTQNASIMNRLLRDKSWTFVQISDLFGFSSPAYFSRYVQHNLGLNPTDYRE